MISGAGPSLKKRAEKMKVWRSIGVSMLIITDSYSSLWHPIYIPNLIHDCPEMIYSRENHQPPVALETKKPNITFYS